MNRNYTKLVFRFFSFFASFAIQFIWNEYSGLDPYFAPVKNKIHLIFWHLFQIGYPLTSLLYSVQLGTQWHIYLAHKEYVILIIHTYFIVLYLYATSFQYVFLFKRSQVIRLLNETVRLAKHFEQDILPRSTFVKQRASINRIMLMYGIGCLTSMIVVMRPLFLKFHRKYWYLFAYLPEMFYSANLYPITFSISFMWQLWFEFICWGGLGLQIYMVLLFFNTVLSTLRQLIKVVNNNNTESARSRRLLEQIISSLVKLSILLGMYNATMGKYFLPHFFATVGISTIGSLILIVKFVGNPLILAFSGLFLVITGFNLLVLTVLCGRVHSLGAELYRSLNRICRGKRLLRKQIGSIPPPAVKVGSFYEIKRGTALTVLAIIFTATTNLLISLSF